MGLIFTKIILCAGWTGGDRKRAKGSVVLGWGQRPVRGQMMWTWGKAAEVR